MSPLVTLALLGWIPFVCFLFALFPVRRAIIWSYLLGWLFLPTAGWVFEGFPDYSKNNAPSVAVLLALLIFDGGRFLNYRPRWIDVPVLVYTVIPFFSCVSNQIGGSLGQSLYGGLGLFLDQMTMYALPWVIARLYFTKLEHLREIAIAFICAGLIYMPLCLLEVRLSPQLNAWIYGLKMHGLQFVQTKRLGGYRPVVFMQHGLMVGLFLTNVVIVAWWMTKARVLREVWGVPVVWCATALTGTALLAKSTGAIGLLLMGGAVVWLTMIFRTRLFLIALLSLVPLYMFVRAGGIWHGEGIYDVVARIDEVRAGSLTGRMENEDLFLTKARERLLLGWAGWNRWQVTDPDTGKVLTTPDGLWVIALGQYGAVGLTNIYMMMLLPMFLFLHRFRPRDWFTQTVAPAGAMATVLVLFAIDCLLNAMLSGFYFLAAGATAGVLLATTVTRPASRRAGAAEPVNHSSRTDTAPGVPIT